MNKMVVKIVIHLFFVSLIPTWVADVPQHVVADFGQNGVSHPELVGKYSATLDKQAFTLKHFRTI